MSPDTAFEVMSGLETLGLRMERHCENAKKAAEFLSGHDLVEWVRFPGLKGDPAYDLSEKYVLRALSVIHQLLFRPSDSRKADIDTSRAA